MGVIPKASSATLYRDMWDALADWALSQRPPLTVTRFTADDIDAFLNARSAKNFPEPGLSARYALRLARLVDRVFAHHAIALNEPPNTAASQWLAQVPSVRYADAARADPIPETLTPREARQLICALTGRPGQHAAPLKPAEAWRDLRNRAATALQLAAGLTPVEIRSISADALKDRHDAGTRLRFYVQVPDQDSLVPREVPVAPWAFKLLNRWLSVRKAHALGGGFMFPATLAGKQWGKQSQYKCTKAELALAGVAVDEGGTFKLRHTFAVRCLRKGHSSHQVALWLGVQAEAVGKYARSRSCENLGRQPA